MPEQPEKSIDQVIHEDGRYPNKAYEFLHEAMTKAVENTKSLKGGKPEQKHVTGRQICLAVRDMAIDRWGMLAKTVLAGWNIHATIDFGNMVYLLIRHDFMRKTDEDSIDDFRDVFDFDEAFGSVDHLELAE